MKVLIGIPFDEELGGVSYIVGNLARELKRRGHEVLFLFSGKGFRVKRKVTKFGFPGFEVRLQCPFGERNAIVSLLAFLVLFPIGIYQVLSLLRKNNVEIINVHYPTECFFYLALCKRILGRPLVTSVHGADLFPDGERPNEYSPLLTFFLQASNLVVGPSQFLKQRVITEWPKLTRKTTYIHNGIKLSDLSVALEEKGTGPSEPYVLCVSAYKVQKAIDVLIRAFAFVTVSFPKVRLVVVGDGPLRAEMINLSASLGITGQVDLLTRKAHVEIITLLRGCTLFVLPSRFETFGIAVLEAMACEKPVIATRVGGIPEIVQDGISGLLVAPDHPQALADAIQKFLSNQTLQIKLAANAYNTARQQFDFARTAESYETALTRIQSGATEGRNFGGLSFRA